MKFMGCLEYAVCFLLAVFARFLALLMEKPEMYEGEVAVLGESGRKLCSVYAQKGACYRDVRRLACSALDLNEHAVALQHGYTGEILSLSMPVRLSEVQIAAVKDDLTAQQRMYANNRLAERYRGQLSAWETMKSGNPRYDGAVMILHDNLRQSFFYPERALPLSKLLRLCDLPEGNTYVGKHGIMSKETVVALGDMIMRIE